MARNIERWAYGSCDYRNFQLKDGEILIDPSLADEVQMVFKEKKTGTNTTFKTSDGSPKLFIVDAAGITGAETPGKVLQLRPAADDFSPNTEYEIRFVLVDSVGPHMVPEGKAYWVKIGKEW